MNRLGADCWSSSQLDLADHSFALSRRGCNSVLMGGHMVLRMNGVLWLFLTELG